jgi:hypothetical protein
MIISKNGLAIALLASSALTCSMAAEGQEQAAGGGSTPAEKKPETVGENMDNRRIFPTVDEAKAYLAASAQRFSDFGSVPLAMPGLVKNEDGSVQAGEDGLPVTDEAVYTDSMDVMVSLLKKQGEGVKAIVVAPVPKVSVLLDSDTGRAFVEKILHKELNHVAVRPLRDAADVLNFVDQMPTTVDSYITSERGSGGIMETFDALYKGIDSALGGKFPNWAKRRFIKSELKKAMESKGYASEFYSDCEDYKGQSLFEAAIALGINAAKRKGLDPTIFQRWADTRNQKTYTPDATDEDDEELNLDSLTDALLADESKDAAPAPAGEGESSPPTGEANAEAPAADAEATA